MAKPTPATPADRQRSSRHLRFGWWSLFLFAGLGLTLELLHGFKVGAYLDVSNDTRRLMWRLAHAHGALLGLIHIVYGVTLTAYGDTLSDPLAGSALLAASVLLPAGFFLGGIVFYSGDPGLGIALVPVGAGALLLALYRIARRVSRT